MKTRAAVAFEAKWPLDEINKAFELMHAGESLRSVVVFDGAGER